MLSRFAIAACEIKRNHNLGFQPDVDVRTKFVGAYKSFMMEMKEGM